MEGEGNNADADELISQFMAFTGSADPAKAASYLEMSGNNVETAVGLYMEHEAGGGGGVAASAAGGGGGGAPAGMMEDDIRAPDATRTMRLMDHDSMMGMPPHHQHAMAGMLPAGGDPAYHLMNAMMNEEIAQSAFAAAPPMDARAALDAAIAAQSQARLVSRGIDSSEEEKENEEEKEGDGDDYDMEDDDDVEVVARPQEPANLTDMFSPPTHLIHRAGGFQGARAMAKDSKRWLLVNIQSNGEFASHALNRDVWRDELVENLVREGFIFWQQMNSLPEGRTYIERYQVGDYPHIAILDPRTGRLLWRKEGWTQENPFTAAQFAEMAMDFCSKNTFDRPPQAPRAAAAAAARPAKRPMNEMSEAEQLEAAMRASMADATGGANEDGDAEIQYEGEDEDDDVEVAEERKPAAEEKPPSLNDELLGVAVPAEPADGSRIQLRMPDGKKAVRRFMPSDPVRTIYAYIAQSMEEARGGRAFVLMAGFPPNDLINDIDNTIEASGLKGQAITVRWK